jgi:hypothetical protein
MFGINRGAEFSKLARAVVEADEALDRWHAANTDGDESPIELRRADTLARDAMIRWLSREHVGHDDPIFADQQFVAARAIQADGLIVVRKSKVTRLFFGAEPKTSGAQS